MNASACVQMLMAQLPQSVEKGSIHDSSQNIRELTLCQFFFFLFFVMSDWIPLFHIHAGYPMNYVKKKKKKNVLF